MNISKEYHLILIIIGLLISTVWLLVLFLVLDYDSRISHTIIGVSFPISLQVLMWYLFFTSLVYFVKFYIEVKRHASGLKQAKLPEDERVIIQKKDLKKYFQPVREDAVKERSYASQMIFNVIYQVHNTNSVRGLSDIVYKNIEYFSNEIDIKYNLANYIVWLLPTLGFIGTVIGIMDALTFVSEVGVNNINNSFDMVVEKMSVAFDTTLVALCLSSILMFFLNLVRSEHEKILNESGKYCLRFLVNKIYDPLLVQ